MLLENRKDKELLDWLGTQNASLISDRNRHWSVSYNGLQDQPKKDKNTCEIHASFFIPSYKWSKTIRGAIRAAQKKIKRTNGGSLNV